MSESNRSDPGRASSRRFPARDRAVGPTNSLARCAVAVLLVGAGVAWIAVYLNVAEDGGRLAWMSDLGRWNYAIGFLSIFVGLAVSAHPSTPLGRGRGVVVGMLGCFIVGLVWICVYYIAGREPIPVVQDLQNYNLIVGIGFMAVGFVFATRWE